MESSRKRPHCQKEDLHLHLDLDLEDRISSLPDALLCYILSKIPTLWAVRTTVLAKRWNTLWTYIDTYDFDNYSMHQDFITFGDTVFKNTNASSIRTFRLSCFCWAHEISYLYVWVCTAIARNVNEIDLSIRTKSPIHLPKDLFTCQTLVSLKLSSTYFLKIPEIVRFSSLKILKICHWKCLFDDDDITRLLDGTPVLEELCLQGIVFKNLRTLLVRCFTLKRLTVSTLNPKPLKENLVHDVVIDAPGLEYLNFKDCNSNGLELKPLPVITYANVCFFGFDDGVFEFLSKVTNVKHLLLFPKAGMPVVGVPEVLPMLHNLTHLEVQIIDNWELVSSILECSPSLQVLKCEKVMRCSINRHQGHPASTCEWHPPVDVPTCLSCLTRIEIRVNGCDNEMKVVKYLLKNAMALKRMVIGRSTNFVKKLEPRILKELLRFSRGSVTCEVEFES
ncbi:hypothetical protein OSB04_007770 [Centaurea solstitialis]|uniref:FBD domain-containing protein n=1 Tax=Centaurea solstitialis TaxID=347529 RepID=A0AA38WR18_9ASTR|nr:hypothetical protein OSB04_007770 [Centaurea solstitialis]